MTVNSCNTGNDAYVLITYFELIVQIKVKWNKWIIKSETVTGQWLKLKMLVHWSHNKNNSFSESNKYYRII